MEEDHDDLSRLAAEPFPERPVDGLMDDVGDPSRRIVFIEQGIVVMVLQKRPTVLFADAGNAWPGNPATDCRRMTVVINDDGNRAGQYDADTQLSLLWLFTDVNGNYERYVICNTYRYISQCLGSVYACILKTRYSK